MGNIVTIRGQVERVTYHNEDNGYTVIKVVIPGRRDVVTATGSIASVAAGEELKLTGEWVHNKQYGQQFKVIKSESLIPATEKGIEKYLGSGLIKGIGPVMAKRLVAKFKEDTINIIENDIQRLAEVDGIGKHRIDMIRRAWDEQKEIKNVMIFLQGNGVSTAYAVKIYKHYGNDSINIVTNNPYRLASDIHGIGFLTADKIAINMGIPKDSEYRAEAGITYTLNQLADKGGHTYYPYEDLITECIKILGVDREVIVKAFGNISLEGRIVIEDMNTGQEILPNNKAVFLSRYHSAEESITKSLYYIKQHPKNVRQFDKDKALLWVQRTQGITLAENQVQAVRDALENKVMIITGGPGTGKTTVVNSIVKIYEQLGQKVVLSAPTGRAAKKMSEATGKEAKTIHRLLEYSQKGFKRNLANPIHADVAIVDETSMVDVSIMKDFLKAVPRSATVILVGDIDQLPSVGPGNVLKDMINSGTVHTVRLNQIFRQAQNSLIVTNAHRINNGKMPEYRTGNADCHRDFHLIEIDDVTQIVEKVLALCKKGMSELPVSGNFDPFNDIQVITPMNKGVIGTENLNIALQKALNPSHDEISKFGRTFKSGDKVMQTTNNYDKDVFNGDIGRIRKIDKERQEMTVDFDGKNIAYDFSEIDELVLAYAISVHKSQGSEFKSVVMPVSMHHYMMLQRNLIYTGITRGKELVALIGTKKAIGVAVNNNKQQKRFTKLRERLSGQTVYPCVSNKESLLKTHNQLSF